LDPESAREIQLLIQTLASQGKTIFLTSHNLAEVERLCQRIAIMENGLLQKIGTMEQLVSENVTGLPLKISTGLITVQCKGMLMNELTSNCSDLLIGQREISCIISNASKIPRIITYLVNQKIEIYSVESKKVSLEDISLQNSPYILI
jgi:ABC-2 type transport system ATP-binding protein